jgi:hypothetical protein
MKRTLYLCLTAGSLSLLLVGMAGAQSLGEIARRQRQVKRPSAAKVYTNDDMPSLAAPKPEAAATGQKTESKEAPTEAKPTPEDKAKQGAALQAKADGLKNQIALLEREYTVAEREYKLRTAVYYADAGNSLRDPKKWAEQDRQYQAEMATKKKAIDDARQKLADLQEQARKAGLSVQ